MKLKNYVLPCAGKSLFIPCSYPSVGDALVIVSREHRQFGVQVFIQELLTFPGDGIPKLILFWCLFRTRFTNFKMILNVNWQNVDSDQSKHLIGRLFQTFLCIIMLQSMFASALITFLPVSVKIYEK